LYTDEAIKTAVIAFLASKPASDVTVAQCRTHGEWRRESAAAHDVNRKGTREEGQPKEGEKSGDDAHDRDT
jgi:hypothetical protein